MPHDALGEGNCHGTLVALPRGVKWHGALLQGAAGSGKSDLALRLIDRGWRLVADDRVDLSDRDGAVYGRAPVETAGKIAIAGLGIVEQDYLAEAAVELSVQLAADPPAYPFDKGVQTICGAPLPVLKVDAFWPSAPIIVERALLAAMDGKA